MTAREPEPGPDGRLRCPWGLSTPDYLAYHDEEWGRRVDSDDAMFERLTLEAFQSGLSWLIVLRKRRAFRAAFAGFSIPAVAGFGEDDVRRLLADVGIVRNRAKIDAAISNARAVAELPGGLLAYAESFAPEQPRPAPRTLSDVPASTAESTAMARDLRRRGVRFVGPTTAHSLMQATGIVDDHLADCCCRGAGARTNGSG